MNPEPSEPIALRASRQWAASATRIPPVIAITGGFGCGKSACSTWMARHNIPVVDADIVNARVLDTDEDCLAEITEAFGKDVLDEFSRVDRKKMSKIIFADARQRQRAEAILHPRIRRLVRAQVQEWRHMGAPYILLVIPLLPATSLDEWPMDWIVVISAERGKRIERALRRKPESTTASIEAVLRAQSSDEEYRAIADEVIHNNGSVEDFRAELDALHERILAKFSD